MLRPVVLLLTALSFLPHAVAQQQPAFQPTDAALAGYAGTYAPPGGAKTMLQASPRDHALYALVHESLYKLTPVAPDLFRANGNQTVKFSRVNGVVTGYTQQKEPFAPRISTKPPFPPGFWYARGEGKPYAYQYAAPRDRHDGIAVASVESAGLDPVPLQTLVSRITDNTYPGVDSVLIMKDGKLVFEEYFYGNDADSLHQLRSATKSFTSALVGIAVRRGMVPDANAPILPLMPEYNVNRAAAGQDPITIYDLLTQQSGFACDEDDPNSPGFEINIYPKHDWTDFILNLPMQWKPGTVGKYCSANSLLLDDIVQHVSHQKLEDFARQNLFAPLGVTHFWWDFAPNDSHKDDYGQARLRARDMAKFGQMYLNGGTWNGTRILSEDWVRETLTVHSQVEGLGYGYLWWVEDMTVNGVAYRGYAAKGNGGQRIFLWPQIHMLAVVTASDYNRQSPANRLLQECVLASVKPETK